LGSNFILLAYPEKSQNGYIVEANVNVFWMNTPPSVGPKKITKGKEPINTVVWD
jgi:hypothetical protein